MQKIKLLFSKFLKWELTEDDLRTVLLEETEKSPKFTYTLYKTVNNVWFVCENLASIGIGVRVRTRDLSTHELFNIPQFLSKHVEQRRGY